MKPGITWFSCAAKWQSDITLGEPRRQPGYRRGQRGAAVRLDVGARAGGRRLRLAVPHLRAASENDAKLVRQLGQLQPFIAVFPQECMGQFVSSGPT